MTRNKLFVKVVAGVLLAACAVTGVAFATSSSNYVTSQLGLRAAGSTTSGQTGPIVMGATTTSAPSYSNGQTNFLSLTPTGGLRVEGSGAAAAAVSGNPLLIAGSDSTNAQTLAVDTSGRLKVTGAAASGASVAGNPVLAGFNAIANEAAPATVTAGQATNAKSSLDGRLLVQQMHPNHWNVNVAVSTATTIQAVGGSAAAPGAGLCHYITDISFGSSAAGSTAADSFPTIKYGTGGTCGSGTGVLWSAMITANGQVEAHQHTPLKVPVNNEICWIMSTAGSKVLTITGYIASCSS